MGEREDTALHEAVRYGDLEEVEAALRDGYDANQIGLYEWGPLHEAAHNGELAILQLLLKYDGEPDRRDLLRGRTAVHYAASEGNVDCLKLLLKEGGRYDIADNDGKTPLDVASTSCRNILNTLKTNNTIKAKEDEVIASVGLSESTAYNSWSHEMSVDTDAQSCPESRPQSVQSGGTGSSGDQSRTLSHASVTSSVVRHLQVDNLSQAESLTDSDSISVLSESSGANALGRRWASGKPVTLDKKLVLGNIQLSFEYNRKKATMKIRVWQLVDLVLPPVETSMISGIYVKSHLLPDKRASTKRKTDVRPSYIPDQDPNSSKKKIQPSCYVFNQGLIYNKMSPDMIQERVIHIEVCIIQKFMRRSFIIGTWNMPLVQAARLLVKEYYPLTTKIGTSLPANMKVYPAQQLSLERHARPYHSNPGTRAPSRVSLQTDRAISDGDLQHVIEIEELEAVDEIVRKAALAVSKAPSGVIPGQLADEEKTPGSLQTVSIELHPPPVMKLTMPSDEEGEEETEFTEVAVSMCEESLLASASSAIAIPDESDVSLTGSVHDLHNLEGIVVEPQVHRSASIKDGEVAVEVEPGDSKPKRRMSPSKRFSWGSKRASKERLDEVVDRLQPAAMGRKRSSSRHRSKDVTKKTSDSPRSIGAASRPDTPSWDDYGEPPGFTLEPIDFEFDVYSNNSPHLPMETHMDLPSVHGNFQPRAKQTDNQKPRVSNESLLSSGTQQTPSDSAAQQSEHGVQSQTRRAAKQTAILGEQLVHSGGPDPISGGHINWSYESHESDTKSGEDMEMHKLAHRAQEMLVLADLDESDIEEIHV